MCLNTGCYGIVCRYVSAARHYADSKISFEEVSLKFITEGQQEALKTFLQRKLVTIDRKVGVVTHRYYWFHIIQHLLCLYPEAILYKDILTVLEISFILWKFSFIFHIYQ